MPKACHDKTLSLHYFHKRSTSHIVSRFSSIRTAIMATDAKNAIDHDEMAFVQTSELPTRLAENVSYGRGGMRGIASSPYVFGAALLASLGGFSFGYDQGVISIINVMPQFHKVLPDAATPFGKGFMTGMLQLGCFLGCLFFPYMADKISRKRAIMVVVVIFDIGAILQTAAVNYPMMVIGRTIGGIGVGTLAMVRATTDKSMRSVC